MCHRKARPAGGGAREAVRIGGKVLALPSLRTMIARLFFSIRFWGKHNVIMTAFRRQVHKAAKQERDTLLKTKRAVLAACTD